MANAKQIRVEPINGTNARAFIAKWHYSGKSYCKSRLHLGAFLGDRLIGVMQFGDPLDRRKVIGLVAGTKWNDMIELNRMATVNSAPRNTESRFISVSLRMIRKQYPNMEWVLTYADATRCGDGTIYRAAGAVLTGIKKNCGIHKYRGHIYTTVGINTSSAMRSKFSALSGAPIRRVKDLAEHGGVTLSGYQIRYIFPLVPGVVDRLAVPVLPYSDIQRVGAGMYLGKRGGSADSGTPVPAGGGGAIPTPSLIQNGAES